MSITIKRIKKIIVLFAALALMSAAVLPAAAIGETVYAGGNAFGIKFFTKGALVVGISAVETASGLASPSKEAGIRSGDLITAVDGDEVLSGDEFLRIVSESGGKSMKMTVMRGETTFETTVKPVSDAQSGAYRLGMYIRDSAAGIGTVTYVLSDGRFAGLGHGICDSETGTLLPLAEGAVVDVEITGVVKGKRNMPGELKGTFGSVRKGTLFSNTETGVYGGYYRFPKALTEPTVTAHAKEGRAQILTTLGRDGIKSYDIEIESVDGSQSTKNLMIKVVDKELIERAGGIVQGMSGSPIMQDGKLVGAVTHVLVGDPTRGYGIFIENMLDAAE